MKKILIAVCALMMCLVLGACGQDADTGEDIEEEDTYSYQVFSMEVGTQLEPFTSEDLAGNEVTESVWSGKDVTIVNVWATFCDPCIGEMEELQKLSEELPDNAQVIGVVIDTEPGDEELLEEARQICSEKGVQFTCIRASESIYKTFELVEAVPTTFIIDKEGKTVCTPIVGADVEAYREAAKAYLETL